MPANKLKAGFGEGVCTVLQALCNMSLHNKFKYKKPALNSQKDEPGGFGDDDGDDMENDFEGNADVADMMHDKVSDADEIDDDFEFGAVGGVKEPQVDQELL